MCTCAGIVRAFYKALALVVLSAACLHLNVLLIGMGLSAHHVSCCAPCACVCAKQAAIRRRWTSASYCWRPAHHKALS